MKVAAKKINPVELPEIMDYIIQSNRITNSTPSTEYTLYQKRVFTRDTILTQD